MAELNTRQERVLGSVVEEFIQTAELVGSRNLTRRRELGVSPATVRTAMADLEERGYLDQPHTSAGRRPTDRGYRYYVDHLMAEGAVSAGERRRLRQQIVSGDGDLDAVLDFASKALSAACQQVGIVVTPSFQSRVFRHIDFVLLRPGRVLVILVAGSGVVDHRSVDAPEVARQAELDRMAAYLDELLEGLPLGAVRGRILEEMVGEKALYDRLLFDALHLGSLALADDRPLGEELYVGDRLRLLDQPEFTDVAQMKTVFEAFEKKGLILTLLDRAAEAEPRHVLIGGESCVPDLCNCSVVSRKYGRGGRTVGTVGVLGPTRMDYPRVIGLVDYTARLIDEYLETL